MKNLIIVGNGFDLAHGLKTSYMNVAEHLKNNTTYYSDKVDKTISVNPRNHLIRCLLKGLTSNRWQLWADIEHIYFDILKNIEDHHYLSRTYDLSQYLNDVQQLNLDFEEFKNYLRTYLKEEQKNLITNENYTSFFKVLSETKLETIVLNFNYTSTISGYLQGTGIEEVKIHGDLDDDANPMIFGFAAKDEDSRKLLEQNNSEYVKNIKKFNYLYTDNVQKLKDFLSFDDCNVFILGHSCGVSDTLILNQIFNSKNVTSIIPFYYKNKSSYFETMVNIDRIIDDYSKQPDTQKNFTKLYGFKDCYPMPQMEIDNDFLPYMLTTLGKTDKSSSERDYLVMSS